MASHQGRQKIRRRRLIRLKRNESGNPPVDSISGENTPRPRTLPSPERADTTSVLITRLSDKGWCPAPGPRAKHRHSLHDTPSEDHRMSLAHSHGIHDLAATFVHEFLHRAGMTVRYRADLRVPYAANSDTGRILLPPGLDWPTEHARLDRCFLYLVGGVQMAPEFDKSTAVVPPVRQSNVVPMLRRPW